MICPNPPIGSVWQWRYPGFNGRPDKIITVIVLRVLPSQSPEYSTTQVRVALLTDGLLRYNHWDSCAFDIDGAERHAEMTLIWGGPNDELPPIGSVWTWRTEEHSRYYETLVVIGYGETALTSRLTSAHVYHSRTVKCIRLLPVPIIDQVEWPVSVFPAVRRAQLANSHISPYLRRLC